MKLQTAQDVFTHKIAAIYSAENQIADKGLPAMIAAANDNKLVEGFKMHLEETRQQIKRLDQVIDLCNISRDDFFTCPVMKQMIDSTAMMVKNSDKGAVRDVMLIGSGQQVEHYEICSYGTLVELAKKMGQAQAANLLQQSLEEEKATDLKLNEVANNVNEEALGKAANLYTKKSAA